MLFLGVSSGLPLALTASTLQAWFVVKHVSLVTVGWLTLLGQPYIYKFLWAPLLDHYYLSKLGRRRSWLFASQIMLLFLIGSLAFLSPQKDLKLICVIGLLISFFSATQDIAFDGYRAEALDEKVQGLGSAVMIIGYRIGMLISGGLALVLADWLGWAMTYFLLSLFMIIGIGATALAPESSNSLKKKLISRSLIDSFLNPAMDLWIRPFGLAIFSFVVLYKLGEAFSVSLGTAFLINGLGFSLTEVGSIYKTVGLLGSIIGSCIGGMLVNCITLYRCLFFFGIFQSIGVLLFLGLAIIGKSYLLMITAVFTENMGAGMASVALMVFLMRLCNQQYTASQYALFAALAACGRVFVGPIAAYFVAHYHWKQFFEFGFILTLPGLLLLHFLRDKINVFKRGDN